MNTTLLPDGTKVLANPNGTPKKVLSKGQGLRLTLQIPGATMVPAERELPNIGPAWHIALPKE